MFTITSTSTSTRIVGLIAVVCAAIVAPQALAMPIIDSQNATPTIIAPPADGIQGYDLSGLDPSVLNGIRSYQQQEEYLRGLPQVALAAAGTHKSVKVQPELLWQSPLGPGGIVRASKGGKAASTAAAIKALQRRSVALDAAYRKLYPGAYRQAAPKSSTAAVWKFPACSQDAAAEYDSYSGDPCIWTGPAPTGGTIILTATFVDTPTNPLGDLKNGRVVFTEATHKSVKASTLGYMQTNPGWGAAATAAKKPAAVPAPVFCNGQAAAAAGWGGCP